MIIRRDVLGFDDVDATAVLRWIKVADRHLQSLVDAVAGAVEIPARIGIFARECIHFVFGTHAGLTAVEAGVVEIRATDTEHGPISRIAPAVTPVA